MVARPRCRSHGRLRYVLFAVAMVTLVGCGDADPAVGPIGPVGPVGQAEDAIQGSGEITAEQREIEDVTRLVLEGEGNAVVVVGSGPSLTVETDANLLDHIESEVDGNTLRLRTIGADDIEPTESVAYRIELAELSSVEIAGAGTITVGTWTTATAEVGLTGVGELIIEELLAQDLVVERTGVGTVRIDGSTDHQDVTADGVGDYDAAGLDSSSARIVADGAVDVTVRVSGSLEVDAAGTATVNYEGPVSDDIRTQDLATVNWLGELS